MQKANTGKFSIFNANKYRIGIVVAQFNQHITEQLLENSLDMLQKYNVPPEQIHTIRVAGCGEIPLGLQSMARSGNYDCLLAVGVVIKGDTPHFDYVCKIVTEGILRVELDCQIPIGFGILTCDNEKQAIDRQELGGEHIQAALQLKKAIDSI